MGFSLTFSPNFAVSFLHDLYEFDLATLEWADITNQILGTPPPHKFYHGFTSADGILYTFGGMNAAGAPQIL